MICVALYWATFTLLLWAIKPTDAKYSSQQNLDVLPDDDEDDNSFYFNALEKNEIHNFGSTSQNHAMSQHDIFNDDSFLQFPVSSWLGFSATSGN